MKNSEIVGIPFSDRDQSLSLCSTRLAGRTCHQHQHFTAITQLGLLRTVTNPHRLQYPIKRPLILLQIVSLRTRERKSSASHAVENSLLAVTWTRCCRYTERYLYMCPRKTLVSASNSGRKGWSIFRSDVRSDSQPSRVPRLCASHQHRYRIGTIWSFEAKAHFYDAYPGSFNLHSNKRILSISNCLCNVVFMHDQTNSTRPFPPNTRLSITRYLPAKLFHH